MSVGTQVASLYGVLSLQDDMTPALNDADGKLKDFDSKAESYGKRAMKWGSAITGASIAGASLLAALAKPAIDAAVQWESAFSKVEAAYGGTGEKLDALERGLRRLATSGVTSSLENAHEQLAGIAVVLAEYNIPTRNLLQFVEAAAMLQMTTNIDGEGAAALVAQFAELTKMNPDNVMKLASALVWIGNNLGGNEKAVMDMSIAVAAAGKAAGLSEANILGFSAAILQIAPGASAKNINDFLTTFTRIIAEGGPAFETLASVAGMDMSGFTTLFETDPSQALLDFFTGLGGMDTAAQIDALEKMGIAAGPLQEIMLLMAEHVELLNKALAGSDSAWQTGTEALTEAEQKAETTAAKWASFQNNLKDILISMGEVLLPPMKELLDIVTPLMADMGGLGATVITVAMGLIGLGLVIGPIVTAVGGMSTIVGLLATAVAAIGAPIVVVIGLVGLLAYAWNTNLFGMRDAVQVVIDKIGELITWINQAASDLNSLLGLGGSGEFASNASGSTSQLAWAATTNAGANGVSWEDWQSGAWQNSKGGGGFSFSSGMGGYAGMGAGGTAAGAGMGAGGTARGAGTTVQVIMPNGGVLFEAVVDEAKRRNSPIMGGATP